ncbi:thiamine-phosphate synthase family protein [uncultured Methanospirillum sp.]|uniref:thiamine-phosphate synthase family protein n=1 Tax=uncultured Methanospirillum sp. TaxID=262503 RepID=UPI0029C91FC0|nr:thiamine-phosphate synthase family protein [uncultured Methanospirillum sp.]
MSDELVELYGYFSLALEKIEQCREFGLLIPEVRTNLVYARKSARTRDDVLAVDGRITVVNGMPHAAGRPRLGASSHMARLIIELAKVDPSYRAGIDFMNNPEFAIWLKDYCASKGWAFSVIDRSNEPEEVKEKECGSMPWKVAEAVRACGGVAPKVFYETGAVGKEPVTVLVGKNPIEVVDQVIELAHQYLTEKSKR